MSDTPDDEAAGIGPEDGVLLEAGRGPFDSDALVRACGETLARLIGERLPADLGDADLSWESPDSSYLLVESPLDPDTTVYVQVVLGTDGILVVEVDSGRLNPASRRFSDTPAATKLLEELGFTLGDDGGNWRRFLEEFEPDEDAPLLAEDLLRVFSLVFGYAGATELRWKIDRYRHSRVASVYDGFSLTSLQALLQAWGYRAALLAPEGEPEAIASAAGGLDFLVQPMGPPDELDRYAGAVLIGSFALPDAADAEAIASTLDAEIMIAWAEASGESEVSIFLRLEFSGGVTTEWLRERWRRWEALLPHAAERIRELALDEAG
ncbi:MAG: hypothetical protein NW201_02560 [Gemmatimonadales bacterium]|nr:hypothetical protein [Gemmatimonadales bacterium]